MRYSQQEYESCGGNPAYFARWTIDGGAAQLWESEGVLPVSYLRGDMKDVPPHKRSRRARSRGRLVVAACFLLGVTGTAAACIAMVLK